MDEHLSQPPKRQKQQRLGFITGAFQVPADFDRMNEEAIKNLFDGDAAERPPSPRGKR